jgi:putative transposase
MIKDSAKSEIRYVMRATIILSAAEGKSTKEIAKELKKSRQTVALWRNRFAAMRMEALQDAKGRGRKRKYKPEKIEMLIEETITSSPNNATHWSTRSMAKELGLSHMTV